MLGLEARGLSVSPKLAVGDDALGFWKALEEIWLDTRIQRCWFYKTGNILNKLPKSLQAKAIADLHNIWMTESKEEANKAFDVFIEKYKAKDPQAALCLEKDREDLLAFYDFPAEHWKHIRTTNPIESTFATVKHRTKRFKGCLSRGMALVMIFKLIKDSEKTWRRLEVRISCQKSSLVLSLRMVVNSPPHGELIAA